MTEYDEHHRRKRQRRAWVESHHLPQYWWVPAWRTLGFVRRVTRAQLVAMGY